MDDHEVVDTKPRRKMKPRSKWKKYRRPGKGELLALDELARALGETPRTIRGWTSKGLVPRIVLGRKTIRYRLESVLAALDKRETKTRRRTFYEAPL